MLPGQSNRAHSTVSIHAPAGGATCAPCRSSPFHPVSIHAPAGGATECHKQTFTTIFVSIHAPAGGATRSCARTGFCRPSFNPRARGGRDFHTPPVEQAKRRFQSTRPRGARPPSLIRKAIDSPVSIHAPAGGATEGKLQTRSWEKVSIHAPAGGATQYDSTAMISAQFQSTRPRGARLQCPRSLSGPQSFNPRARGGRDDFKKAKISRIFLFQSTRPRGARHAIEVTPELGFAVSIHAPAGGATCPCPCPCPCVLLFQSTRPRGARRSSSPHYR